MKVKREYVALIGVLLFIMGIEMVIIQSVVLNKTVSRLVVEKFYPQKTESLMVTDQEGNISVHPISVKVPDTIGPCVGTSGFVLLLTCFLVIKPE